MTKQYLSIPVQYNTSTQLQADDIKIPVEILVMHDNINLNNSNFEFDVIDAEETKESIKNIPILGYIKKVDGSDEKDFAGHEIEVTFRNGDIKVTYLERPIGVCPETNNYEYVEKDGKKYVKVIGYLWKDYMNDGYEVLQENPSKSVSMEIVVDAYEVKKNGIVDIKAYRYTGITVLGDNVSPAMQGANMQVIGQFNDNQKFSQEFYQRVEKLNKELNFKNVSLEGGETQEMSKKKEGNQIVDEKKLELIAKYNFTLEQLDFSIEELSIEELESKLKEISIGQDDKTNVSFSVTYNQKREALRNALDPIIVKDANNKIVEETYFWVCDFDDEYVYVEKDYWTVNNYECTYGRVKYTFDETTITATVDMNTWDKMIKVWLTEAENQKIQEERNQYEIMSAEFEQLKSQVTEYEIKAKEFEATINTITEENTTLKTENENLTNFKNNTEKSSHETAVNDVFTEFDESLKENQEYIDFKEKVNTDIMNYKVEDIEKELFAMVGKVNFSKSNKNVKKEKMSASVIDNVNGEIIGSRYGKYEKFLSKIE